MEMPRPAAEHTVEISSRLRWVFWVVLHVCSLSEHTQENTNARRTHARSSFASDPVVLVVTLVASGPVVLAVVFTGRG
jgi:hypothetical protein